MTDWKLIFYGTEIAPEDDEHEDEDTSVEVSGSKIDLKPSEVLANGEEDPDHNSVEPVKGGVWKEVHRVDTSDHARNEVQRTTTEDDMASASAGCLVLSKKGQQCIGLCLLLVFILSIFNSSFSFLTLFATNCDGNMSHSECTEMLDSGSTVPCLMISQEWRTDFHNEIRTERTVNLYSDISNFQTRPH
jgi:hypothetical protein